jgi:predicted nucleic acid-binding Zn ribbon protein
MARKMMCAICNDAIPEDDTTVLRVMVKPPAKGGVATPAVDVSVDVCSTACLREYLEKGRAMKDLGESLARWKNVGAIPSGRRLPP